MPRAGKPAASTALPQPAKVNQKVPKNSAPRRRGISIQSPLQHSLTQPDRIGGYRTGKGQSGVTERFYNLSAVGEGGLNVRVGSWLRVNESAPSFAGRYLLIALSLPMSARRQYAAGKCGAVFLPLQSADFYMENIPKKSLYLFSSIGLCGMS